MATSVCDAGAFLGVHCGGCNRPLGSGAPALKILRAPNEDKTRLACLILLAPFQRLPDDFVFVRAREIPQEALARSLVDERRKSSRLRAPPGV
jgi:hypothetical protein